MKKLMTLMMVAGVGLLAGCSQNVEQSNVAPAVTPPAAFVAAEPTGTPTPIPEARKTLKPGDEVLLKGRVMGVSAPFVEGRAVFVLGDTGTLTPCNEREDDHCSKPWDTCCDPADIRAAGTATIQVLGDGGKVLAHGLKGVGGLKELSTVAVSGVVAPMATPEAFVINATAIYVAN